MEIAVHSYLSFHVSLRRQELGCCTQREPLCSFFVVGKMQTQLTPKTHYKFYTNIEFF